MARILFLENHNEIFRLSKYHWYDNKWNYFWHFKQLLRDNNHEIQNFKKELIKPHHLKESDMAILGLPLKNLSEEEISLIEQFVSDGGGLLLTDGAISWPKPPKSEYGQLHQDFPRCGGVLLRESGYHEDFTELSIIPKFFRY